MTMRFGIRRAIAATALVATGAFGLAGCSGSDAPVARVAPSASAPADAAVKGYREPDGPPQRADVVVTAPKVGHPRFDRFVKSEAELVRAGDVVVIGTVAAERRGALDTSQGPDLTIQLRLLDIRPERILYGPNADGFQLTEWGWYIYRNRHGQTEESRAVMHGDLQLMPGDRGVFVLRPEPGGGYRLLNHQAAYLFKDGEVRDTEREDAFVKRMEQLSETQLVERLEAESRRRG